MSGVRVLVGTRKGAFVLTSDGKRERWDVSGPALPGLGDLPRQGVARRPGPAVRLAVQRLVRPGHPALRRRRRDLGAGGQRVPIRRRPRDAPVVRRHAAPVGVRAGLAPGAVARRSGHRLRRGRGRWPVPVRRRRAAWQELPGLRASGSGAVVAAGRGRDVPAHDHAGPGRRPAGCYAAISAAGAFRSDDDGQTWRPVNRGLQSEGIPDPRTPRSGTACTGWRCTPRGPDVLYMQKHWDVMRSDDAGESWHEISGNLPDRFRVPDRRARARAGHRLRGPDHQRLPPFPAGGEAARLPQPHRRGRVGGAHQRPAAANTATSTCCVTRWPWTRWTTCGVYFGTTGGQVYASADAGDNWAPIVRDLPAVLSVEVQTLP